MENLEREKFNIEEAEIKDNELSKEEKEILLEQAEKEAQERIRQELKELQKESNDEFLKILNIDIIEPSALMVINELVKRNENLLSEKVMDAARKFYFENNELLKGTGVYGYYDPVKPEDEAEFLKAEIANHPEVFYTPEILKSDTDEDFKMAA
ncbi:MAG: hypothetical protein AAB405_00195 [Patescibacteria group bacterium]